jgi:hypothetical protein
MRAARAKHLLAFLVCVAGLQSGAIEMSERLHLNGYASVEFEKQLGTEGKGDPNGSFDVDLFDLVLNVDVSDRMRVAADLTWEHGTATEDDRGNVAVEYAFGEYTVYDWLRIRAGKMFVHFGIYNEMHTAKPAFLSVKEPRSTNKSDKFGSRDRFYPRWGAGLAMLGNGSIGDRDFDYVLQVLNGEQEKTNPFEEDDNKEKALCGRLRFSPADRMRVGFSLYRDTVDAWDELAPEVKVGSSDIFSAGNQLEYSFSRLGIELEYVWGSVGSAGAGDLTRWASSAMVFYRIRDTITPYVRYEFLDPDMDTSDDEANLWIYGCNFMLERGLFLKFELNSVRAGSANSYFEGAEYEEIKAAAAISF